MSTFSVGGGGGIELKGLPQPPDKPFNPKRRGFFGIAKVKRPKAKFDPKKRAFFGKIRVSAPRAKRGKKSGPKQKLKQFGPRRQRIRKSGPKQRQLGRGATSVRSSARSRSFRPKKNVLVDKILKMIKARVRKASGASGASDFRNRGFTGSRNGRTGWAGR